MKQKLCFKLLWLPAFFSSGLLAQQSITSAGGDGSGSGGTINFSVGQPVFTGVTGGTTTVNQGVQQAYDFSDVGIEKNAFVNLFVTAYPNPVVGQLHLSVTDPELKNASYALYDQSGKFIRQEKVVSTETLIDMQELANAIYFLKVSDSGKLIRSFQIIKHN
jgi:hypothetical protein